MKSKHTMMKPIYLTLWYRSNNLIQDTSGWIDYQYDWTLNLLNFYLINYFEFIYLINENISFVLKNSNDG